MLQTPRNAGLKTTNSFLKKKLANLNERISPRGKKKRGGGEETKAKQWLKERALYLPRESFFSVM